MTEKTSEYGNLNIYKIAVTGKMRTGKSTVVELLGEEMQTLVGNDTVVIEAGFGDMLKYFAHDIFLVKILEEKPRELYQEFGQAMRAVHNKIYGNEDVWVNLLDMYLETRYKEISSSLPEGQKQNIVVLVTDLRQPNEKAWCERKGFKIVKVVAPLEMRVQRMKENGDNFTEESIHHETETHVDNFETEYTITNDGTIEDLQSQVKFSALEIYSDLLG